MTDTGQTKDIENKYLKIVLATGSGLLYFQGLSQKIDGNFLIFDDRKEGLIRLNLNNIVSIKELNANNGGANPK